ncbi:MAG: glutamine-synthetase adenylyltransferase, partial [Pseudomonadota bacterium]
MTADLDNAPAHGRDGVAPPSLAELLATAPPLPVLDAARARQALAALDGPLAAAPAAPVVEAAAGASPFLARLLDQEGAWIATVAGQAPEAILDALVAEANAGAGRDRAAVMAGLRRLRRRAALAIALADLAGPGDAATLARTTGRLTRLAEAAIAIAIGYEIAAQAARGALPIDPATPLAATGYTVIGMGKLGAGELNYSSDIDLICLFDQDRFAPEAEAEARQAFIRATRGMVELLSRQTGDGYVFRTDLRLRPNPSSLPVCLSMAAAERYYEAEGRTWERAAHIKARTVAGDAEAGDGYLQRLAPFVWRRSLDFYAIAEVQGLLGQIRAKAGEHEAPTAATRPGTDIKRAPGGIREIELFVQT